MQAAVVHLSDQLRAARALRSIPDLLAIDHLAKRHRVDPTGIPRDRLFAVAMANLACLRIAKRARTLALALYLDAEGADADLLPFVGLFWRSVDERIAAIIEAQAADEEIEVRWHLRKLTQDLADALSRFDEADRGDYPALARV